MADRVERVGQLVAHAEAVWANPQDARRFITSTQTMLGGAPLDMVADSTVGARRAEALLGRIDHGIVAREHGGFIEASTTHSTRPAHKHTEGAGTPGAGPPSGRRPVCILTRDAAIPLLNKVTCAPITRTIRGIPSEVEVAVDLGLPERAVISCDNVITVAKTDLDESPVGHLDRATRARLDQALQFSLDIIY